MWKHDRTHHKDRIYSNSINNSTAIIKHNCQSSARTQTEPDTEWKSWFPAVRSGGITFSLIFTDQRQSKQACDISITWPHLHISITWPHLQWGHEEVGSILLFLKRWNGIVWRICHDDEALIEGRADLNRKPCYSFHTWRGVYINDLKQKTPVRREIVEKKLIMTLERKGYHEKFC